MEITKLLSNNPTIAIILTVTLCLVILVFSVVYIIAFVQGREISFWPPKIGQRPTKENATELKSQAIAKNKLSRILFIACNPMDTQRLRLDKEIREIKKSLASSKFIHRYELIQEWAITKSELVFTLKKHEPSIIHFSGHGTVDGIILENEEGYSYLLSSKQLSSILEITKRPSLVLLNSMYSSRTCKEISDNTDISIGIEGTLTDEFAISFVSAFYRGIGNNINAQESFNLATNSIEADKHGTYKLFSKFSNLNKR